MPEVTIELPGLLSDVVAEPSVRVEADTLRGALDGLVDRHPGLRVHLFNERGDLREHVLCFHNGANSRWLDGDPPVAENDVISILQAVSGG